MTEQKSAPKKKKVGSLFFHLFNRLSLWIYTLLINCFPARLLSSYEVLESRWGELCSRVFGTPDKKFRQNLHKIRLRCAYLIERSIILRSLDRLVKFFINCPLNMYGIFFFMYGAVGAAVYFVAERLSVNYAGNLGWGIAGIVIAFASLPLLCTGKSLYRAAFGSRIVGKILRSYLGLEQRRKSKEKERGSTLMVYAALILGVGAGALTFFVHPATVPVLALLLVLAITVLYIPESGVLLAAGTVGIWWITGYPVLCAVLIAIITLISYASKLIRGKRVMHVRLVDFSLLLLVGVFALNGLLTQGSALSMIYGFGYALLIAMYFPIVNLMRSREWLDRCYKLLAVSGTVLAVVSVLPMAQILYLLDITIARVDLSIFATLFARYDAYFGQSSMVCGMLMLLLPVMLSRFVGKRTVTGSFWKVLWVIAACVSIFFTMQIGVWAGFLTAMAIFFFVYSHRSLSAAMLISFPVTCAAVWHKELNSLLGLRQLPIIQSVLDAATAYADGAAYRRQIAQGVLRMSADNRLGVGFGDVAVHSVLAQYAAPGMENVTDIQNTYLQLLAECGYIGVLMLLGFLLMFTICVLTYLRWGGNHTTKARVAAGLAGVFGVLVMGISCNLMNNASLFGLIWLIVGLTVASLRTQYDTHDRAVHTHVGSGERTDVAFRKR